MAVPTDRLAWLELSGSSYPSTVLMPSDAQF